MDILLIQMKEITEERTYEGNIKTFSQARDCKMVKPTIKQTTLDDSRMDLLDLQLLKYPRKITRCCKAY